MTRKLILEREGGGGCRTPMEKEAPEEIRGEVKAHCSRHHSQPFLAIKPLLAQNLFSLPPPIIALICLDYLASSRVQFSKVILKMLYTYLVSL